MPSMNWVILAILILLALLGVSAWTLWVWIVIPFLVLFFIVVKIAEWLSWRRIDRRFRSGSGPAES